MQALADSIAQHAVAVLVGVALLLLVATALFWRLVQRYAPMCWRVVVMVWNWLASTRVAARLRQLSLLGPAMSRTRQAVRYLGVLATVAFAVAAFAIVVFSEVVDEIEVGESMAEFDVALSAALRSHLSNETAQVFATITHLGDGAVLTGLGTVRRRAPDGAAPMDAGGSMDRRYADRGPAQ